MKNFIVRITATGLYSGYLKPFPGTWGTLPAWAVAFFVIRGNLLPLGLVTAATFLVSIWSAGEAEKLYGHDARRIVIDEWAGMFVSLLFLPYSLTTYVLAFFAFRFWDVVKLPPAAQFEHLPGGWGVTMDDIAAGIYANLSVQLILLLAERVLDHPLV